MMLLFISPTFTWAQSPESVSLPFGLDNKEWKLDWQNRTDTCYITEFVPKEQKVENWKELVTLQFYPNLQNSPAEDFMNNFLSHLQKSDPGVKIQPISNSADNSIVEWHILKSKLNPDQYEVDRVFKGKTGMHMIHYAVKTSEWSDNERTKWLKFLDSVK